MDEGSVNDVLYNYARARNQGEKQDKAFRDDPNKKAGIRKMRQGKDEQLGTVYFFRQTFLNSNAVKRLHKRQIRTITVVEFRAFKQ